MKKIKLNIQVYVLALALAATACTARTKSSLQSFPTLSKWKVVDLTQPLTANIPIWPGDPKF
jgi:hypothetical protein